MSIAEILPIATLVALIANLIVFSYGYGKLSAKVEHLTTEISAFRGDSRAIETRLREVEVAVAGVRRAEG